MSDSNQIINIIQGSVGPQGPVGQDGTPGIGISGPQGEPGQPGQIGLPGPPGYGAPGPPGPVGRPGDVGPPGPAGPRGFGIEGQDGAQGEIGLYGFRGPTGSQGVPGIPPKILFTVEAANGPTGLANSTAQVGSGDTVRVWSLGGIDTLVEPGSGLINLEPANLIASNGIPVGAPPDPSRPVIYVNNIDNKMYSWNPNLGGGGAWLQQTQGNEITPPGAQGAQGADGDVGEVGMTGAQGDVGNVGDNGMQGAQGCQGFQGFQGVQGHQGLFGYQGAQGRSGPQGPIGVPGSDGQDGMDGQDGVDGVPGQDGQNGQDGQDGQDGTDGADGSGGIAGDPGDLGDEGDSGNDGPPGDIGDKGDMGVASGTTMEVGLITGGSGNNAGVGQYIKIGNMVFVTCQIEIDYRTYVGAPGAQGEGIMTIDIGNFTSWVGMPGSFSSDNDMTGVGASGDNSGADGSRVHSGNIRGNVGTQSIIFQCASPHGTSDNGDILTGFAFSYRDSS